MTETEIVTAEEKRKLRDYGWHTRNDETLNSFCKEHLINIIQALEHNYAKALLSLENETALNATKDELLSWHWLAKDPQDLPKQGSTVLVYWVEDITKPKSKQGGITTCWYDEVEEDTEEDYDVHCDFTEAFNEPFERYYRVLAWQYLSNP